MTELEKILQKNLSANYNEDILNLVIKIIKKIGAEGIVRYDTGGTGSPFQLLQEKPSMKADNLAMKEIKKLRELQSQSNTDKDRKFYTNKIAEIVGAVVTVRINLAADEFDHTVSKVQDALEQAKQLVLTGT